MKKVSIKTKIIAGVGAIALGTTNSFALAATDFVTTTAETDMGFAAVASITLAVLGMGFAFVKKVLH